MNQQTNQKISYNLVSFPICPFVQRSVITLRHKKLNYELEYIDLANKPEWFLKRVPTGKVPALFLGDDTLFESAAINEFIDETSGASLLSSDPVIRAKERAWVSYSEQLLTTQFQMMNAKNEDDFSNKKDTLLQGIFRLADHIMAPFFSGNTLGAVDIAIAPVFTRLLITDSIYKELVQKSGSQSKLIQWIEKIVNLDEVKKSVREDFVQLWVEYFKSKNSYYLSQRKDMAA